MIFTEFETRAHEIFREIPPEYREGVDGLTVLPKALPHPSLPDVYTLGECRSEFYPSDYGGAGEVRSIVVLFYGSFVALSRRDEEFEWEEELFETVTHEVRHHLESLASEDALEVQDYAEDQNFARREGEAFDPFFFRAGEEHGGGVFEVGGDLFVEREIESVAFAGEPFITIAVDGKELRVSRPERLGDVHFVTLRGWERDRGGLILVLVRRRSAWESLRTLLRADEPEVLQSEAEAESIR